MIFIKRNLVFAQDRKKGGSRLEFVTLACLTLNNHEVYRFFDSYTRYLKKE